MIEWFIQLSLAYQMLILYLIMVNVATFFYFGIDKIKSRLDARRVSERTLWFLACIGGSLGALAGMSFFRHKTRKPSFQAAIAAILCLHILIVLAVIYRT